MAFKMMVWACGFLFIAMLYNVIGAYSAMGSANVQDKFQEIGLLEQSGEFPLPPRKPLNAMQFAEK